MADISAVVLPNDATVYNLKDATARSDISSLQTSKQDALPTSATNKVLSTNNSNAFQWNAVPLFYGTCSTAAGTQTKVVTITGIAALYTGLCIRVQFTNEQTYNGVPQLNVNSLGATEIRRPYNNKNIDTATEPRAARYEWAKGAILDLTYDGTYWIIAGRGRATTTYYGTTKLVDGAFSTDSGNALTARSLFYSNGGLINGSYVAAYSSTSKYSVDALVYHEMKVWKCSTAITTAEAWNSAHWTLQGNVNDLRYGVIYSATETYSVGDRVLYGYNNWICNTAITTAEAWTEAHWTKVEPLMFQMPTSTSVSNTGLVSFKNIMGETAFTLQLPLFDGSVT